MFVLGLQGSPRKKGNTSYFLSVFMKEAEKLGAEAVTVNVSEKDIHPCIACKTCDNIGYCSIDDYMSEELYSLIRRADLIVMASPVFFYSVTAQMKALIDRTQTLWARKYIHKLDAPDRKWKKGFLLSIGATKGKSLFEGITLTAKYFFDAAGASFNDRLMYRQIENPGDAEKLLSAVREIKEKATEFVKPFLLKKKIIFVCRENACRSQMAGAFAQIYAGDRFEVMAGGSEPAEKINETMEDVMKENGIDMAFRRPQTIEEATRNLSPDFVITMGCEVSCPVFPGAEIIEWNLPDPAGKSIAFMRELRDKIEKKIIDLLKEM